MEIILFQFLCNSVLALPQYRLLAALLQLRQSHKKDKYSTKLTKMGGIEIIKNCNHKKLNLCVFN